MDPNSMKFYFLRIGQQFAKEIKDKALEPPREGGYLYRKYVQQNVNWDSKATIEQLELEINRLQNHNCELINENGNYCLSNMQLQQIVNDQENQLNNIKELSDNLNRTNIAINIEKDEISRQFEKANNTLIQYQELTRQMVPKLPQLLMKVNTYDNEQAMLNNYLQLDDCVETWSHDLQLETDLILSQYNK